MTVNEIAATQRTLRSCHPTCLLFVKTITVSAVFLFFLSLKKSEATRKTTKCKGRTFLSPTPPFLLDANFHFNCVKPLFLTSEKCVCVRVLIRESKNTACRIFMLITL